MIDPLPSKPVDAPARAEGNSDAVTARSYEDEHDLWQMQDLLMQARLETDDWRYAHVGDLLFQFFMVACHLNPPEHIRLWHADGKLVGYAVLGEDPSIDWQIRRLYESVGFVIVNQYLEYVQTE